MSFAVSRCRLHPSGLLHQTLADVHLSRPPQDLTAGAASFDLVEDSTYSLRLQQVQVTDAGSYVVEATNRHGSARRTMSLEVTGKGQSTGLHTVEVFEFSLLSFS